VNTDESGRFWVIFGPDVDELIEGVRLNRQIKLVALAQKGINNDRDEQVDEYLRDQDVEKDEEGVCHYWRPTSKRLTSILHHSFIALALSTLVCLRVGPS